MHSGSFGCLLPRSLLGQNEIASLLFYIPSLYHSSIENHTHTRARANCRKACQPSRASSLFAMDRYSFLSRPLLGMHSWILIVCLFSRHSCAAKKSLFFAFVREKKKKETEKRRRNLDLRHRFSSVEVPSLRVCCPSVVDRSARGKFPFLSKF